MVFLKQYKMLTIALQQQKNILPVYHLLRILRSGHADVCTCNIIFLWHFYSHVESTYYDRISSLREEACAHKTSLTPPLFTTYLCTFLYYVHRFASFYDFAIEFWNCSNSMVCVSLH